ncbi:YceI family protein [uncultured Amaricoccus sp.]|uniref:YceI family protein n=1 Tax=uncultured Amaricoccus sp. TaxID=339341 RepID=UPI00260E545F|nr:YceI family protein [uncultured Amaricoccus sp.]
MPRSILLALAIAGFGQAVSATTPPGTPPAPAGVYVADPAHTSVAWSLDHSGLSHWTARFVGAKAVLDWKPEEPAASTLRVEIDPRSLRTDFPFPEETDFDGMIAGSEDFLAGKPIVFVSDSIEVTGENTGLVHGDLTMRGETHPATLAVTFNGSMAEHPFAKVAKVGFSATASFDRSDWGLDTLVPLIGDRIDVTIETQFMPEGS